MVEQNLKKQPLPFSFEGFVISGCRNWRVPTYLWLVVGHMFTGKMSMYRKRVCGFCLIF